MHKIGENKVLFEFYVHVTVHRNKFLFDQTKRRTNFPKFIFVKKIYVSGSSSAHHQEFSHCTFGTGICHQTCTTYTSAEFTVENS